jgi:hypothetical protein
VADAVNLSLDTPEDSAKQIVDRIAKLENAHQNGMDTLYNNMPELFFKAMRRILPGLLLILNIIISNWN